MKPSEHSRARRRLSLEREILNSSTRGVKRSASCEPHSNKENLLHGTSSPKKLCTKSFYSSKSKSYITPLERSQLSIHNSDATSVEENVAKKDPESKQVMKLSKIKTSTSKSKSKPTMKLIQKGKSVEYVKQNEVQNYDSPEKKIFKGGSRRNARSLKQQVMSSVTMQLSGYHGTSKPSKASPKIKPAKKKTSNVTVNKGVNSLHKISHHSPVESLKPSKHKTFDLGDADNCVNISSRLDVSSAEKSSFVKNVDKITDSTAVSVDSPALSAVREVSSSKKNSSVKGINKSLDCPMLKTDTPKMYALQGTSESKKDSLVRRVTKIPGSPKLKADSPRLYKLRQKTKSSVDTADMLHSLFDKPSPVKRSAVSPKKAAPPSKRQRVASDQDRNSLMASNLNDSSNRSTGQAAEKSSSHRKSTNNVSSSKMYPVFNHCKNSDLRKTKSHSNVQSSQIQPSQHTLDSTTTRGKVGKDKGDKKQLLLDFGQQLTGHIQCTECGMTYNGDEQEDMALHSKFHQKIFNSLRFRGWKKENVEQEYLDERIISVLPGDVHSRKKIEAVKQIVDDELGFVVEHKAIKPDSKMYMYIADKKIVGFCVADCIKQAYKVLPEGTSNIFDSPVKSSQCLTDGSSTSSSPATQQSSSKNSAASPWCCSTKPVSAKCGINRIWVMTGYRKRGIATRILNCVRSTFLMGCPLTLRDIAFTDPTPDGRAFASAYTKCNDFLVYKFTA